MFENSVRVFRISQKTSIIKLFFKDLKVYLYPLKDRRTGEIRNSENLKVHPRMKELYKFFKYNELQNEPN